MEDPWQMEVTEEAKAARDAAEAAGESAESAAETVQAGGAEENEK